LTDAITYLKYLQYQIHEMEASKEDMDQRCQSLETKCKTLEERNQELVEIISQDMKPSSSVVHLNHLKLHSMKSI
jgi:chaperonin cofactor prefoldin